MSAISISSSGNAAIAPFGIAWQGQAGLPGLERPAPGIRAGGLADHAPLEFPVAGILQPVDQDDHLPRRRVDQADVGRIEPAARERADRERLIVPERNHVQRLLALACVLRRAVPDPDIVFAGEPFVVLGAKPDHRAALAAYQVVGGDADGPAQTRGHADDLVGGVDRIRPADLRDRFHLRCLSEQLHADHRRLQPQQAVEIGNEAGKIDPLRTLLLHRVLPAGGRAPVLCSCCATSF
ncbi:hypothetical protein ACVIW2_000880 [Bradyrhizobium huanghuaihaiense]